MTFGMGLTPSVIVPSSQPSAGAAWFVPGIMTSMLVAIDMHNIVAASAFRRWSLIIVKNSSRYVYPCRYPSFGGMGIDWVPILKGPVAYILVSFLDVTGDSSPRRPMCA